MEIYLINVLLTKYVELLLDKQKQVKSSKDLLEMKCTKVQGVS